MRKLIKNTGFLGTLYLLSASFFPVAADTLDVNLKPTDSQFSGLGDLTLGQIISAAIVLVLIIAAIIFFFMLVIGGVRWIISGGDKASTEAARAQITAALIGLVIVFAAWAIAQIINVFFGIDIFNLQFSGVS